MLYVFLSSSALFILTTTHTCKLLAPRSLLCESTSDGGNDGQWTTDTLTMRASSSCSTSSRMTSFSVDCSSRAPRSSVMASALRSRSRFLRSHPGSRRHRWDFLIGFSHSSESWSTCNFTSRSFPAPHKLCRLISFSSSTFNSTHELNFTFTNYKLERNRMLLTNQVLVYKKGVINLSFILMTDNSLRRAEKPKERMEQLQALQETPFRFIYQIRAGKYLLFQDSELLVDHVRIRSAPLSGFYGVVCQLARQTEEGNLVNALCKLKFWMLQQLYLQHSAHEMNCKSP